MAAHGRPGTYNAGCRCDICIDANRERCARIRASLATRRAASPDSVPHGMSGYVNWGCRCGICSAAVREYGYGDWDISRTGKPWTAEEIVSVQRDDIPVWEIARDLKRSYNSVVRKRYRIRRVAA